MMIKLLALAAVSATPAAAGIPAEMKEDLAALQRDGIDADSELGRQLIAKSRRVEQQDNENEQDISFVAKYSIKFMGCHHVTQWASEEEIEEMDEENDDENNQEEGRTPSAANGRIRSKGLVRYRLCPSDSCFDHFGAGCSSNFGEYIVDMYSFLETYIGWRVENAAYQCQTYRNTCYKKCYESSNANCYSNCYKGYGVDASLCANSGEDAYGNEYDSYGNEFSLEDYLQCGEYDIINNDGEEIAHYLGPYCSAQGGDIRLGFFQDQYCTIASSYQANYFEKMTGITIPYTKESMITTNCLSCVSTEQENEAQGEQDYYNYDADGNRNYYVADQVNDLCGTMYMLSGKCETEFSEDIVPYPEEGGCTYMESVKRLKNDGIIRSDQRVSSKPAAIAIGIFTGVAAMLAMYVGYLKQKIARSRVNLTGATTSLA